MAVASLATAWCSYQSSCWSGQSGDSATRANNAERQAIALHFEAQQVQAVQIQILMEIIDAHLAGKEEVERFYTDRIAAEFKTAYEKWIALKPYENPAAPPHPFVSGLYQPRNQQDIAVARAEAKAAREKSNAAGGYASSYLGITVLLASVLFFAGTAGKFDQRHVRQFSLGFGITMFLYAAFRIILLPIST